jgi:hypothetical protein
MWSSAGSAPVFLGGKLQAKIPVEALQHGVHMERKMTAILLPKEEEDWLLTSGNAKSFRQLL